MAAADDRSVTAPSPAGADAKVQVRRRGWGRRLLAFVGPAYLVSVGYMDPGNWATDIEGGARFGYALIWVLLMSNLMAVLLQTLAARLGIVTGHDLAQGCRREYPRPVGMALWGLAEIAIAATDLAVETMLRYGDPAAEIIAAAAESRFDLLVMGSHGHRGLEDVVFGQTVTSVRHAVTTPVLIVRTQVEPTPTG